MLLKVRKILANFLVSIAGFLDSAHIKLDHWAVKLLVVRNSSTAKRLESLASDSIAFKSRPREIADGLALGDIALADSAYLYFLTKQAVALYEAQINFLPLQVYNEMRNALDHYMRSIVGTLPLERREKHINQMSGHLQRALLDVIKLTCAAMIGKIDGIHGHLGEPALCLAMNGDYIKKITDLKMLAEQSLVAAKMIEYELGDGSDADARVRDKYLAALAAHSITYKYHQDSIGQLRWGRAKYLTLKGTTITLTIVGAVIAGIIVRVMWAASEDLPIITKLIQFIKYIAGQ